jgi:hypothetical protein
MASGVAALVDSLVDRSTPWTMAILSFSPSLTSTAVRITGVIACDRH